MAWTEIINDTFTGSGKLSAHSPDLGDDWTCHVADFSFVSNSIYGDDFTNFALNDTVAADDQAAQVLMSDGNGALCPVVRGSYSGGNAGGYYWRVQSFGSELGLFTGSGTTRDDLDPGAGGSNGDTTRLEVVDDDLVGYINGTPECSASDETYGSGLLGIVSSIGQNGDDFVGEEDAGVAAPVITDVTPDTFADEDTGVVIDGTGFVDPCVNGCELGDNADHALANTWTQTVTDQTGSTQLEITIEAGDLANGTVYLFVQNEVGDWSDGFPVTLTGQPEGNRRRRVLLCGAAA